MYGCGSPRPRPSLGKFLPYTVLNKYYLPVTKNSALVVANFVESLSWWTQIGFRIRIPSSGALNQRLLLKNSLVFRRGRKFSDQNFLFCSKFCDFVRKVNTVISFLLIVTDDPFSYLVSISS